MSIPRRTTYEAAGTQDAILAPLLGQAILASLAEVSSRLPQGFLTLDIGAGECPLKPEMEARGSRYSSLDITQNSNKTIDHVGRIDAILPSNLSQYDLLLCTEVLEHVPDWAQAFKNFHVLLKPGGYLLVTCPFFYMLHEEPHDYWRPTNHALRYFAEQHGFSIQTDRRLGDGGDALGTMLGSLHVQRRRKVLSAYLPTIALHLGLGLLRRMMRWVWIKNLVAIEGRFYLSNVMLLRKEERS